MKRYLYILITSFLILALAGCQQPDVGDQTDVTAREWSWVLDSADGTSATLYHNLESEDKLEWLEKTVKTRLESSGITLRLEKKPIMELIDKLEQEKINEIESGTIDLILVDGSDMAMLYEKDLVYGPFLNKVPNYHTNVNPEDYEFMYAEGQELNYSALPVFRNQLAMVYDEDVLDEPPATLEEMIDLIMASPGSFTFPMPDDQSGRQFMETFFATFSDYETLYRVNPTREEVEAAVVPALEKLRVLKNALYKKGEIYPADEEQQDMLFFEGQIGFALTTNPVKASKRSRIETYPFGARAFIPAGGTVGDTMYMVIPFNSANKSAGMIFANETLTADVQLAKYKPSEGSDLPVVDTSRMDSAEAKKLTTVTIKRADIKQADLLAGRIPDMPERTSMILAEIWREILE